MLAAGTLMLAAGTGDVDGVQAGQRCSPAGLRLGLDWLGHSEWEPYAGFLLSS